MCLVSVMSKVGWDASHGGCAKALSQVKSSLVDFAINAEVEVTRSIDVQVQTAVVKCPRRQDHVASGNKSGNAATFYPPARVLYHGPVSVCLSVSVSYVP